MAKPIGALFRRSAKLGSIPGRASVTWHVALGALAIVVGGAVLVVDLILGDGLTTAAVASASSFTAAVAIAHRRGAGD